MSATELTSASPLHEMLADEPAPGDLFADVLERVATRHDWDLAAAWWREPGEPAYECHALWHRPTAHAERLARELRSAPLVPTAGAAGAALETGETVENAGALAIPLRSAGITHGVVAPYSATPRRADDATSARKDLEAVAKQLAHYLDRWIAHALLKRSDRALAAAANGVVVADATRPGFPVTYANAGFERLTGYAAEEVIGRPCSILQGPDTDEDAIGELARALSLGREAKVVLRNYRKDGTAFWNEVVLSPVHEDGRLTQYIGLQYDVSERREAEERVWYLAYHDPLTGLANRAMLTKHIDRALERAADGERQVALLFLDLDDFKVINDGLGHVTGDQVLCSVAEVLRSVVRTTDLVVRQGGDEFLVLLADVDGEAEAAAARLAEEITLALREPLAVGDRRLTVRASTGISLFPRDAASAQELLGNADHAMYRAKRSGGGGFRVYQRGRSSEQARAMVTGGGSQADLSSSGDVGDLDAVLAPAALRSQYQPIVDLATRETMAYEALARGPAGSPLERPDLLFATARALGRVDELDWACRTAAVVGAQAAGLTKPRSLFVNVEPAALDTPCPPDVLPAWQEAAESLRPVLEITERALTSRPAELLEAARQVRAQGWGIALDDVGADTRSLALMPLLRPDVIKLDLRLVQEQPGAEVAEIVNAVNAERERTGSLILAEGIETEANLEAALALGATLGQGWLFGRPGELADAAVPGLSLARVASPPAAGVTPYQIVREVRAVRAGSKRLLLALSNQLEQQALALGPGAVVISAFQSADRFTRRTRRRYTALAADAAFVAALGVGMEPEPAPGVRGSVVPEGDPLLGEWSIAVIGPHFAGALVALDRGDTGPDMERGFDFALTYDRDLVIEAANSLMARVLARCRAATLRRPRRRGGVATQRPAKPFTPVRFWSAPLS